MLFADDEIEAVQVIDDILDGPGEDSHHDDGEDERCHRCRHFEAIAASNQTNDCYIKSIHFNPSGLIQGN